MKETGTTEEAILTNHKPESDVNRLQSPPLHTASHTCLPLVGCRSSSHVIRSQRDKGLAEASVVQYTCALIRRYMGLLH
uniref:Uncharacterized protein n=1 Tax=Mesocestoides corti TaxID=53468 RepID=A0A5K3FPY3_MESCO